MSSFKDFIKKDNRIPPEQSGLPSQEAIMQQQMQTQTEQMGQEGEGQDGQEMVPSQGNPFDNSSFNNVNLPDQPIQYGGSMAESMLSNDEVPKEIRKKHWYIFHKDNVLTFLDEERKRQKMLNFDILKIDMLNSMPYYDYNFDKEMEFTVLRGIMDTKLDRALGTNKQVKNERTVLQSQFTEARQISEMENSSIKEGFLKKLLGRR